MLHNLGIVKSPFHAGSYLSVAVLINLRSVMLQPITVSSLFNNETLVDKAISLHKAINTSAMPSTLVFDQNHVYSPLFKCIVL